MYFPLYLIRFNKGQNILSFTKYPTHNSVSLPQSGNKMVGQQGRWFNLLPINNKKRAKI